jgi:hypothetical protein
MMPMRAIIVERSRSATNSRALDRGQPFAALLLCMRSTTGAKLHWPDTCRPLICSDIAQYGYRSW